MKSFLDRFESFLHGKNLRLTAQRAEVLRCIYRTHRHVTAEELYEMLRKKGDRSISRATVYRTLSLLEEGGFVDALSVGRDEGLRYEHTLGHEHHDHMVCDECGKIIEFHSEAIEAQQEAVAAEHGFTITSHRLNIHGVCKACAAEREQGDERGGDDGASAESSGGTSGSAASAPHA